MNARPGKFTLGYTILVLFFLAAIPLHAQVAQSTLSGKVTGPSGVVPYASVTVKNVTSGQSKTTQADKTGRYSVANLAPGEYEVSVKAIGFAAQSAKVTLAPGGKQTLDLKLTPELSLESLGFSAAQTKGSAHEQELLNKRSHMLQVHQKLGLITFFPLVGTLVAATQTGGRRHPSSTGRNIHMALGSATAGLYFATAYYAIFAPKVPGVEAKGPIRFHKAMAWIHGPGMILTPILGAMADAQANKGERLHGIARYHGQVAVVTAIAYGLALLSETKPNWIPGLEHHAVAMLSFHHHHATLSAAKHPAAPAGGPAMTPAGQAN
jgi:hypothetical protein